MAHVLLTGAAGFIGYHCAHALIKAGHELTAIDNLNNYYDPELKNARLARLKALKGFHFYQADIADPDALAGVLEKRPSVDYIIHLAAQAGVRYSLENPYAYGHSNLSGQISVLEMARTLWEKGQLRHCIYASSSSVYGGNTDFPFSVTDRVDNPVSLYAATKKSGEMLAQSYANLYQIPLTGLRFFTVYGPWGRPDMAYYMFARALYENEPLTLYNKGDMGRDFTYIDDIIKGVISAIDFPPVKGEEGRCYNTSHRIFNLGNNRPERLDRFLEILEELTGQKAQVKDLPMQPGDVKQTYADIDLSEKILGFKPETDLKTGLMKFIKWYKRYHEI